MTETRRRLVPLLYAALLAALASVGLVGIVRCFAAALSFPWAIDYNEGIVWKQMVEIMAGRGYAPIDRFPAIVFHYPPLFHLLAGCLAALGVDPLTAGRTVSFTATLGTIGIASLLVRDAVSPTQSRTSEVAGALLVVPILLSLDAVHFWGPQMRVDPLANFFAMAGILAASAAIRRPGFIYVAALCFVASVFTKQISIVAPAAALLALVFLDRRLAGRLLVACILLGLILLGALVWHTEGGFVRHVFLYNINRFDMSRLLPNLRHAVTIRDSLVLLASAAAFIAIAYRALRDRRRGVAVAPARLLMLIFVPLSTLSLIATAKYGSSSSYYMQWEIGLAIILAIPLGELIEAARARLEAGATVGGLGLAGLPVLVLAVIAMFPDYNHIGRLDLLARQDVLLEKQLRAIPGPVISDEMALLMRVKGDVWWEPAIFAELANVGGWDERIIIDQIAHRRIAAFATDGDRGTRWFDERYNPAVLAAMERHYQRVGRAGAFVIWRPRPAG